MEEDIYEPISDEIDFNTSVRNLIEDEIPAIVDSDNILDFFW